MARALGDTGRIRGLLGSWRRVMRNPYTLLLGTAAVLQLAIANGTGMVHPGWALAAVTGFAAMCAAIVVARVRNLAWLDQVAAFPLLFVAAMWRAAADPLTTGIGGLAVAAVVWVGFYGTRTGIGVAAAGACASLLVGPLLAGEPLHGTDVRRAVLTGALALLVGVTLRSVVERGARSAQRISDLEPAELRLNAVLRAATGHIIMACDPDGTIVAFNDGAERLLGYRADEVVGRHTPLLFHDPDEVEARADELGVEAGPEVLTRAAERNGVEIRDWTYLPKDGRRVIVSLSITTVRNDAGAVTGYVCIGTDVTASRATMHTLASQRELYQLLVEHLPLTTVGLFDHDLRCVTIGGHWLRKIGGEPATFRGTRIDEFFGEADRERALALYDRGRTEAASDEWDLADGRRYEFSTLPLQGPDGETLVLSLARDVTEVRAGEHETERVNAALAVSEASFREAFEGAPIGMAVTSFEDGARERFLQVNPAFAAILGRSPEDLVGMRVADVTHPEDVALQPDLNSRGARDRTMRKRFVRPSGRAVWVDVRYAVVRDADGVPSHVIKQIQDIHAIKESERALLDALEQQRAATARLRELDRIRTELVGTVSHELRTPLTSIHGYLELLRDEPLSQSQEAMVEVAVRNTERLSDMVDNLLVLVRLDSGVDQQAAGPKEVDIASTLSAAIDTIRPEFVDRNQQLDVHLPLERATVRGDVDQLERVLVNLLGNASKYTPQGGRVEVAVSTDRSSDPGQLRIVVADTGIGIPPEEVPQLFTRFFRASTARANSISGNGLGLAIVKSIVERHGGEVGVESQLGNGSRFTVTLPVVGRMPAVARTA